MVISYSFNFIMIYVCTTKVLPLKTVGPRLALKEHSGIFHTVLIINSISFEWDIEEVFTTLIYKLISHNRQNTKKKYD